MYWRKFSGPLLDRVDIRINVANTEKESASVSSAELRKQIADAVLIQRKRQGKKNAYLAPQEILEYCPLEKEERKFLEAIILNNDFSQRAVSGILKLSRTIADMKKSEKIKIPDLSEAISLRANSGPLGLFGNADI